MLTIFLTPLFEVSTRCSVEKEDFLWFGLHGLKTGENLPPAYRNDILGLLSSPSTLHVYPASLPSSRGARKPIPTGARLPPLSTSSRGGEARLESPLSLLSDCLSLSSARRLLLLQMDDWSGSLPALAKQAHF